MQNLDSLGWADGSAHVAFGVSFGLRVTDPLAFPDLHAALPVGARSGESPEVDHLYSVVVAGGRGAGRRRKLHLLFANVHLISRQRSLTATAEDLERDLISLVGTKAPDHVFVHAGVVGWKGRAIVIPGRSFSGKSTLVAALVRHGATYLSDEFAIFDAEGLVHPYPRPLGLRRPGEQKGIPTPVKTIGGRVESCPLPLGMVATIPYDAGASWSSVPTPAGEAVLALVANSLAVREAPKRVLSVLSQACSGSRAIRGTRGEANEAAQALLEMVSNP